MVKFADDLAPSDTKSSFHALSVDIFCERKL